MARGAEKGFQEAVFYLGRQDGVSVAGRLGASRRAKGWAPSGRRAQHRPSAASLHILDVELSQPSRHLEQVQFLP